MKRWLWSHSMCGLAATLALGCGAAPGDLDPVEAAEVEDGELGTAASAICQGAADVTGTQKFASLPWPDNYASFEVSSPTSAYGSADCSGRFVVDTVSLPARRELHVEASWANSFGLTSQAACEAATVDMIVYYQSSWAPGVWFAFGQFIAHGEWQYDECYVSVDVAVPGDWVTAVRVAAKAYRPFFGVPLPARVFTRNVSIF